MGFASTFYLAVVVLAPNLLKVGVSALNCNAQTTGKHIEIGDGACYPWGPDESDYECCLFCKKSTDRRAAQLIYPGEFHPFTRADVNGVECCCYRLGDIKNGGDGTVYYF